MTLTETIKLFVLGSLISGVVVFCSSNHAPVTELQVKTTVITENLAYPWELLWGPDNFIWMTERDGRVSRVNPDNGTVTLLITIPEVQSMGEGGLLGMALHPQFATTPFVYLVYNYSTGGDYRERLVRYTYNGTTLINPQVLLDNVDASYIHNGSRLLVHGNFLFMTTGDAANQALPQNINSLNGKILRLHLDGTVPSDNPFPGNPVWSYGLRNAQGLTVAGDKLYISEHGPDSDDEINIVEKGGNYGWPNVQGECNTGAEQAFCTANQVREPIRTWTPTAAVCGMEYYPHDLIPAWKNSLLMVALKNSRLYQLKLDTQGMQVASVTEHFTNRFGRLRDVCVSPSGKVYFCTSNGSNDKIIVAEPQ